MSFKVIVIIALALIFALPVAAGPVGRDAQVATDVLLKSPVLAYSRSKGLFAGIVLDGAVVSINDSANARVYGKEMTAENIMYGKEDAADQEVRHAAEVAQAIGFITSMKDGFDSVISQDIAGNGGFGLKFFLGHIFAIRFDVRDHVYRQQLLSQVMVVNDLTTTIGVSMYVPFTE